MEEKEQIWIPWQMEMVSKEDEETKAT